MHMRKQKYTLHYDLNRIIKIRKTHLYFTVRHLIDIFHSINKGWYLAGIFIIFLDYAFRRCTCAEGALHGNFNVICVMVPP